MPYLKNKYDTDSYCGSDRLKLFLSESENGLKLIDRNWDSTAYLEVWNDNQGHLCYEPHTRNLHGNSRMIRRLKDQGWSNNQNGRFYNPSKQYLSKLTEDVEDNILKSEKAIENIIKKNTFINQ